MTRFRVMADDGVLLVRAEGGGLPSPTVSRLSASGGVVGLDLVHPEQGIDAFVSDLGRARSWVKPLYGRPVAEALDRIEKHGGEETVDGEDSPFATVVGHALVGEWLRRWWPADSAAVPAIEDWLLDAELAATLWDARGLDPALAERVVELLAPHAEEVARAIRVREDGFAPGDVVVAAIVDVIDEAVEPGDPLAVAVTEALYGRKGASAGPTEPVETAPVELSGPQQVERQGDVVLDPARLPARLLDEAPGACRWWRTEEDGPLLVRVLPAPGAIDRASRVRARLLHPAADPIGVRLRAEGGVLEGVLPVPAQLRPDDDIVIDVYDGRTAAPDDRPVLAADNSARRAAIRQVIEARVSAARAGSTLGRSAATYLAEQAAVWRQEVEDDLFDHALSRLIGEWRIGAHATRETLEGGPSGENEDGPWHGAVDVRVMDEDLICAMLGRPFAPRSWDRPDLDAYPVLRLEQQKDGRLAASVEGLKRVVGTVRLEIVVLPGVTISAELVRDEHGERYFGATDASLTMNQLVEAQPVVRIRAV